MKASSAHCTYERNVSLGADQPGQIPALNHDFRKSFRDLPRLGMTRPPSCSENVVFPDRYAHRPDRLNALHVIRTNERGRYPGDLSTRTQPAFPAPAGGFPAPLENRKARAQLASQCSREKARLLCIQRCTDHQRRHVESASEKSSLPKKKKDGGLSKPVSLQLDICRERSTPSPRTVQRCARKQAKPVKSPPAEDRNFSGVSMYFQLVQQPGGQGDGANACVGLGVNHHFINMGPEAGASQEATWKHHLRPRKLRSRCSHTSIHRRSRYYDTEDSSDFESHTSSGSSNSISSPPYVPPKSLTTTDRLTSLSRKPETSRNKSNGLKAILCNQSVGVQPETLTILRKTILDSDTFDSSPSQSFQRECASCGTKKTPLWRDAEDGTPLCNACGIRYKKYHVRCASCWYIPRKEEKSSVSCPTCHGRFISTRRSQH